MSWALMHGLPLMTAIWLSEAMGPIPSSWPCSMAAMTAAGFPRSPWGAKSVAAIWLARSLAAGTRANVSTGTRSVLMRMPPGPGRE